MASLSNGKCQKATRKVVARVLLNSVSLRGQFHNADVLVKILGLKCGINIDKKTLSKAFSCSDDAYYVVLRDMGVEHDGDDVLYVYKNHQIADGTRITSIGVFESVDAAREIDIADPMQRDGMLQNIADIQLDDALKTQLETALAAEAKKAQKKKDAEEKK